MDHFVSKTRQQLKDVNSVKKGLGSASKENVYRQFPLNTGYGEKILVQLL